MNFELKNAILLRSKNVKSNALRALPFLTKFNNLSEVRVMQIANQHFATRRALAALTRIAADQTSMLDSSRGKLSVLNSAYGQFKGDSTLRLRWLRPL